MNGMSTNKETTTQTPENNSEKKAAPLQMSGFLGRLSIKRKLVTIIMLVSSLVMLLATGTFIAYQWIAFRQRMVQDLSSQAEMLADNCTASLSFDNKRDAGEVLDSLKAKKAISSACVYRSDGSILASYSRKDIITITNFPPPQPEGYHFSKNQLVMFRPVHLNGLNIGTIFIQSDLSELTSFLNQSGIALFLMLLLASATAYLLSSKLQKLVSVPIFHLADTAHIVSQNKDYSIRAVKYTDDELGLLTDAFNSMLVQIEERDIDLRHLRNLLSNIINSMPSALVGIDPEGRITQWNREAERLTGISAPDAQGRTLTDVFPQMAEEMKKVWDAIRKKEPQKNTKIPTRKDGITRFSDVTVYPLIANGVEGAVIRIDDVTDQVRIEEMMIQSEKMLSVGGLAAGMAHEINNPLAGILQNVQVMRNRLNNSLPKNSLIAEECGTTMETIISYMEKRGIFTMINSVMDSGRRAAQIVDNMLSFSRKSESKFSASNLSQLLEKTMELASNDYDLKKKYDFRRIEILRQYDQEMPEVWCESTKIQQVLLNLLKNGAQAMNEKKYADDETPRLTLRVTPEGNMARIEIEDNGPGMDEITRKRIFEPFFTTKEVGTGTGLGLSVSYFIITENHNGTMTVESTPGKGCNFIIRLPMQR
jgi:PAS domain S-box-containing protein